MNLFFKRKYLFEQMYNGDDIEALKVVHVVYCEDVLGFDTCEDCIKFYEEM